MFHRVYISPCKKCHDQYNWKVHLFFFLSLENLPTSQAHSNHDDDTHQPSDMTNRPPSVPARSMVVAINGGFELQDEDDYIAKGGTRFADNDQNRNAVGSARVTFVPRPPSEEKQRTDSSKPPRPLLSSSRPKSSDVGKRSDSSNKNAGKSWPSNSNGRGNGPLRPRRYDRCSDFY